MSPPEDQPTAAQWGSLAAFANTQGNDPQGNPYTATSMADGWAGLTDAQKRKLRLLALAAIALGY